MENKDVLEKIEQLTQILSSKQQEIEKKTKDAEAYKISNDKLTKIVKYVVTGFLIMFLSAMLLLGYTVHKYYQHESQTITTTEEHVREFNTDNGGVIINESGDVSDVANNHGS